MVPTSIARLHPEAAGRIEPPPNAGLTRMTANPDGSFTFGEPLAVR